MCSTGNEILRCTQCKIDLSHVSALALDKTVPGEANFPNRVSLESKTWSLTAEESIASKPVESQDPCSPFASFYFLDIK